MSLGGVPYYLTYVDKGLSATENIQKILCDNNAPLKDEFTKLFHSLFKNADTHQELIKLIASKKEGMSRGELEKKAKLSSGGGRLTVQLKQLEQTNFVESFIPWEKERGEYYKVIDEFCLFWLYWLEGSKSKERLNDFWSKQNQKPNYQVWAGYAFEAICHKHIEQIIVALKIKSAEKVSAWRIKANSVQEVDGTQIDLLIDRNDDAITLCEIKYTDSPFVITKQYANVLQKKVDTFRLATRTTKEIFLVLISANGIKENQYSTEILNGLVTLEALFHN